MQISLEFLSIGFEVLFEVLRRDVKMALAAVQEQKILSICFV